MFFHRLFFSSLIFFSINSFCQADWTIFTYIEASEKLEHEGIANLTEIALGDVPENIHFFVQLHTRGERTWLYKIEGKNIILLDEILIGGNAADNILQTMRTIIPNYPAKHYGVILWNHGFGILIPTYDPVTNTWNVEQDGENCGGTCDLIHVDNLNIEKKKRFRTEHFRYKGLLVNSHTKTVMYNDDMVRLARTISHEILGGKKLDLLGFDCCLGAMLEHGYQLKNYVRYIVGSQDCELADGWDYTQMILNFHNGILSPLEVAQYIAWDYGNYYKPIAPVGRYTQSAIDLGQLDPVVNNLEKIIEAYRKCIALYPDLFVALIRAARNECKRFCQMPAYTDIDNFYSNLFEHVNFYDLPENTKPAVTQLKKLLIEGKALIAKIVVANVTGPVNAHAQGISIYFPLHHLDSSYPSCMFAQETSWLLFIKDLL